MSDSEGLLSQDSYLEVSFEKTAGVAFDEDAKTLTRTVGDFVADGFKIGMDIFTNAPATANKGPYKIVNVTTTVITVDETLADASAAATVITGYIEVGEVVSLNTPSGEPSEIDVTHLKSSRREFRNGLRDEGSISGEMNFVPSDDGQVILRSMQGEKFPRACRITVPSVEEGAESLEGYRWSFQGLARGMPVSLGVDEKATVSFEIRVTGAVTEEVLAVS